MIPGQNIVIGFVVGLLVASIVAMVGSIYCVGVILGAVTGVNVTVGDLIEGDIVGCCIDVGSVNELSEGNNDGRLESIIVGTLLGSNVIFRGAPGFVGSMVGANAEYILFGHLRLFL